MNATTIDDPGLERRARRRVAMKTGFYTHALVYALVNGALFAVNAMTSDVRWAGWPALGWGIGLAIHGIVTLVSLRSEGWRARMLADEMETLRRQQPR